MHRRAVPSLELADQGNGTENLRKGEDPATATSSRETLFRLRAGTDALNRAQPDRGNPSHSPLYIGEGAGASSHFLAGKAKNCFVLNYCDFDDNRNASLVFVTQTLSMRRSLQREQTLTETHDNAAAWAGIGSAIFQLWIQKAVPASVIGVFSTFLYLASILVLHITTPALFSLETVNVYRPVSVETRGLPSYNWSNTPGFDIIDNLAFFLPQPLSLLPSVLQGSVPTLGLHNGTIYDVLIPNEGVGNVTVNGTGFNITCGYLLDVVLTPFENTTSWNATWPGFAPYYEIIHPTRKIIIRSPDKKIAQIIDTEPGMIVPINRTFFGSTFFYSTISILDSSANRGITHDLAPPLYNATSSIQVIGCSQSLINQTTVVDSQSRKRLTLEPEFQKKDSTWSPYTGSTDIAQSFPLNVTGNLFMELWSIWYMMIPPSDFPLVPQGQQMLSVADLPKNITLHALENALSTIVASMFWTLGNVPAAHGFMLPSSVDNGTIPINTISDSLPAAAGQSSISMFFQRPFLLKGNTTITVVSAETRLDLSIIAVAAGLAVSTTLLLLSLPSSVFCLGSGAKLSIDGTGMLQSIWLYRKHPELGTLLEQIDHPTSNRLRAAGMPMRWAKEPGCH
ncbi:hypothetical protein C8J57DRAFT_1250713 [Mycena rebaudengoi]|nr:hypothetical protein C8J57DRAFT_1250713 [Mycena rebaudengoi]